MNFNYNDGGRIESGYKGRTGDCVVRAIAIATNKTYQEVYNELSRRQCLVTKGKDCSARNGVNKNVYKTYLKEIGWKWIPTMFFGKGCKVHLEEGELPMGRLIVCLSKHLTAVIDGVINDTYNPQRNPTPYIVVQGGVTTHHITGGRCVYGYFIKDLL